MECCICFDAVGDEYAFINNEAERGIYHIGCLKEWITRSDNGILTQNKVTSYFVVKNGTTAEVRVSEEGQVEDVSIIYLVMPDTTTEVNASEEAQIEDNSDQEGTIIYFVMLGTLLVIGVIWLYRVYFLHFS